MQMNIPAAIRVHRRRAMKRKKRSFRARGKKEVKDWHELQPNSHTAFSRSLNTRAPFSDTGQERALRDTHTHRHTHGTHTALIGVMISTDLSTFPFAVKDDLFKPKDYFVFRGTERQL